MTLSEVDLERLHDAGVLTTDPEDYQDMKDIFLDRIDYGRMYKAATLAIENRELLASARMFDNFRVLLRRALNLEGSTIVVTPFDDLMESPDPV
ncbi:MAG: hypothetical protein ACE37M_14240 [Henriciella sp.]